MNAAAFDHRATGRTTRLLEACIERALAGEALTFVCANKAGPFIDQAKRLCIERAAPWRILAPCNRIAIGDGEIRFLVREGKTEDDYRLRLAPIGSVVLDHFVAELDAQ